MLEKTIRRTERAADIAERGEQKLEAVVNRGLGEASNLIRRRAASDLGNKVETLGKSLTHHQVLPAHRALSANSPLTDIGKTVLSATGGNPAQVADRVLGIHKATKRISPHDKRMLVKKGLSKVAPQASSLIGLL